jgi:hypothetical protein
MILNINASMQSTPFPHARFNSVIDSEIFNRCHKESQRHPYFKIEKTRTSNPNRIWLNQQSGFLGAIAEEFDADSVKRALGLEMRSTFLGCRTRVELCMDSVGSWLETHATLSNGVW